LSRESVVGTVRVARGIIAEVGPKLANAMLLTLAFEAMCMKIG
jgi:hypothetical protein